MARPAAQEVHMLLTLRRRVEEQFRRLVYRRRHQRLLLRQTARRRLEPRTVREAKLGRRCSVAANVRARGYVSVCTVCHCSHRGRLELCRVLLSHQEPFCLGNADPGS